MIWTITLLSALVLTLIGAVVTQRIAEQATLQTVSLLSQQVTALGDAYQLQIHNLRFMRERLYDVHASAEKNLYDTMSEIIHDNSASFYSAAHYQRYIDNARNLFLFLNLVQNAAEYPPQQITITSAAWGEKHFIWPMSSLFALDFARAASNMMEPTLDDPSKIRVLPAVSVAQRSDLTRHYVLYSGLYPAENPAQADGTIAYVYELRNLNHVLQRSAQPFEGTAYILDMDGRILYDSDALAQGAQWQNLEALKNATTPWVERHGKLYTLVALETEGLLGVAALDASVLHKQIFDYTLLVVAVILALGAFLLICTRWAVRRLSHRVEALQQVMFVAQTGDLTVRADVRQEDEIGILARGCNEMIEKIQQFIEEKYVSELKQKDTDLKLREAALRALQAQIDPHFLNNTLETIRMRAIVNEDHETAMLVERLATLFRARLEDGHVTTLEKEMALLASLIEILGARFDAELVVRLTLPPALKQVAILRDLIQPLVENAFVHGLYLCPEDMEKQLYVCARAEEDTLFIEVTNTHAGRIPNLSEALSRESAARKRVGLRNVHERIALVYGSAYGVSFEHAPGLFTVRLTLKSLGEEALEVIARGGD